MVFDRFVVPDVPGSIKVCHLRSPQSTATTSELRHGQQKDTNSFPLAYAGLDSRWLPMVSV